MATIYLVGGVKKEVDRATAQDLKIKKFGKGAKESGRVVKAMPDKTPVSISGLNCTLKDIKWIEEGGGGQEKIKDNQLERQTLKQRGDERRLEVSMWTPEEKAERMIKTYCFLYYRARGNQGKIEDPVFSGLMQAMVPYFENNPEEHYCPREIWGGVIPRRKVSGSPSSGFKSMQDIIFS